MGVISNGTTLLDAGALDSGIATGAMTLLSTVTASSSATISFTSSISSTYKEYVFKFIDIHPQFDNVNFQFNGSDDDSSHSYDVAKTTTFFDARHDEADTSTSLAYATGNDLAQGTGFQMLSPNVGAGAADECTAGFLHLYDPNNTTFLKHFVSRFNVYHASNFSMDYHMGGYFNTTADITAIQFKFNTGNIDSGTIKMYGIK